MARRDIPTPETNLGKLNESEPAANNLGSLLGGLPQATKEDKKEGDRKERKQAYDRSRNRKMIDLPVELEALVKRVAAEFKCPESQVLVYLAIRGASEVTMDELGSQLKSTKSMRFAAGLILPKAPTALRER